MTTTVATTRADVADALARSVAAGAPIVAVSTVTGDGVAELREALRAALLALPPRPANAPVYLPVDRVFALGGHGTIVTGTLMQGRIAVGDRLTATGIEREARVRGLHVFGEARTSVEAGARVALNLASVERDDLARGCRSCKRAVRNPQRWRRSRSRSSRPRVNS